MAAKVDARSLLLDLVGSLVVVDLLRLEVIGKKEGVRCGIKMVMRMATVCAACRKPLARSVNFSRFMRTPRFDFTLDSVAILQHKAPTGRS